MKFSPYLGFNGCCEEAFEFYQKHLGGRIDGLYRYRGSPMEDQIPDNARGQIMHGEIVLGDYRIMGSDMPPDHFQAIQGIHMMYQADSAEEAERVFAVLAEAGEVRMPLAQTFWATRYGEVTDRFGVPWMVNCE